MGNFWRVFLRVMITIVLAVLAALGFGVDWWVRGVMSWWGTSLAEPTVTLLRIAGAAVGVACIGAIAIPVIWAVFHPRRFSASFNFGRDVEAAVIQFNIRTGQQLPNRTTFARIHVESVRRNVTACTAAIAALEKLDVQDRVMEGLDGTCQLVWAPREHVQIQRIVAPNLPQDLDLFRAVEGVNKLEVLSIGHPQSWLDFFDSPGRYRITVAVHGGNRTEIIRVIVNWRGRWDDFDAASVRSQNS